MEPEWFLEYSGRETYDDPDKPLGDDEPLSPAFWHHAVKRMRKHRHLFETYWKYESKSSEEAKRCRKGSACEMEALCQMEASTVIQHEICTLRASNLHGTKKKQ